MWIVLEGCDGAGKSTLSDVIARILMKSGRSVLQTHLGPPSTPTSALSDSIDGVYAEYNPNGRHYVSDRWSWGCPVYGPIYRADLCKDGYGDFGLAGWRYTELFGLSRGIALILVDADPLILRERLEDRGDDYVDLNDLDTIVSRYRELADESPLIAHSTNPRLDLSDHEREAKSIIEMASMRERQADALAAWPEYIGPAYPDELVVADRPRALEVLVDLGEEWRRTGFVHPSISAAGLSDLSETLGEPAVRREGAQNVLYLQ